MPEIKEVKGDNGNFWADTLRDGLIAPCINVDAEKQVARHCSAISELADFSVRLLGEDEEIRAEDYKGEGAMICLQAIKLISDGLPSQLEHSRELVSNAFGILTSPKENPEPFTEPEDLAKNENTKTGPRENADK